MIMEDYEMAVASLVLGIISLIAWFIPLFGLPISIVGLVLGIKSVKSEKRGMAIAGIVTSSIGLILSVVNGALGAYMAATGQFPGLG
ncbi:MAG: DUF4190 domain-containing protein [Lachnospiraceae bacterium]|nr:DUF4190 domain-containing protein [Lachnospiraceae bacterium]